MKLPEKLTAAKLQYRPKGLEKRTQPSRGWHFQAYNRRKINFADEDNKILSSILGQNCMSCSIHREYLAKDPPEAYRDEGLRKLFKCSIESGGTYCKGPVRYRCPYGFPVSFCNVGVCLHHGRKLIAENKPVQVFFAYCSNIFG